MPLALFRLAFIAAVAFLAAAVGDVVLENISNAAIFWHGHYTDQSTIDVLPVTSAALVTLTIALGMIVRDRLQRLGMSTRTFWSSVSRALPRQVIVRLIPAIFALQLLTLFTMETAEQVLVYGHPLDGTLWLGGPIAVSLTTHLFLSCIGALGCARVVTMLAEPLVRIVRLILAYILNRTNKACLIRCSLFEHIRGVTQLLLIARLAQRGPPAPFVLRHNTA
jgi:hypothetical protein